MELKNHCEHCQVLAVLLIKGEIGDNDVKLTSLILLTTSCEEVQC